MHFQDIWQGEGVVLVEDARLDPRSPHRAPIDVADVRHRRLRQGRTVFTCTIYQAMRLAVSLAISSPRRRGRASSHVREGQALMAKDHLEEEGRAGQVYALTHPVPLIPLAHGRSA